MKVIIAGSRSITNAATVANAIKESGFPVSEVVSGGARGVDKIGEFYAAIDKIPIKQFIPDWDGLGKVAGFIRNQAMADYADALIAVWDGKSRGTKDMIDRATKKGLKVFVYNPNGGGWSLSGTPQLYIPKL